MGVSFIAITGECSLNGPPEFSIVAEIERLHGPRNSSASYIAT